MKILLFLGNKKAPSGVLLGAFAFRSVKLIVKPRIPFPDVLT